MGIFQIRNLTNGKIFVKSSNNMDGKFNSEKFQLRSGNFMNKELQADYTRLGAEQFAFEILDTLPPDTTGEKSAGDWKKDLQALLELWLEKLQPFGEKGYNRI